MPGDFQMNEEVTCDACGRRFKPVMKSRFDRVLGESWFVHCECHKRYDVSTISPLGLQLRADAKAAYDAGDVERGDRLMQEFAGEVQRGADAGGA